MNIKGDYLVMAKIQQRGYVTIGSAFKDFWKGYTDFEGRTTLSGYWWIQLLIFLYYLVLFIIFFASFIANSIGLMILIGTLSFIGWIVLFIPKLALKFRRLKDVGVNTTLAIILLLFGLPTLIPIFILTLFSTDRFVKNKNN